MGSCTTSALNWADGQQIGESVDYAYGDEEEALRSRLRALIDTHVPDDFAGICLLYTSPSPRDS